MTKTTSVMVALMLAALVACGGRVEELAEPAAVEEPASCDELTVDAWCAMAARGGTNVDERADRCCTRWIDEALVDGGAR